MFSGIEMQQNYLASFFPAICAGLGLFLAGAANLLVLRNGIFTRVAATLGAVAIALLAAEEIGQPGVMAGTARYLALGMIPFVILGSRSILSAVAGLVTSAGRPAIRFALLTTAGIGVALGSIITFEAADELDTRSALSDLELLHGSGTATLVERGQAATDKGTMIPLKEPADLRDEQQLSEAEEHYLHSSQFDDFVIRYGAVDDRVNCHGWVFTGGRYILTGSNVNVILSENGYQEQKRPAPGDLVVYRDVGVVSHTAIVQYVTNGLPVLVKGKWGTLGVFLHEVEKSPYGTDFTYYRSARLGHTLAGIDGPPAKSNHTSPPVAE